MPFSHGSKRKGRESNPIAVASAGFRDQSASARSPFPKSPRRESNPQNPHSECGTYTRFRHLGMSSHRGSRTHKIRGLSPARMPVPSGGYEVPEVGVEPTKSRLSIWHVYRVPSPGDKSRRLDLNQRSLASEASGDDQTPLHLDESRPPELNRILPLFRRTRAPATPERETI